jgi:hypothetical protein
VCQNDELVLTEYPTSTTCTGMSIPSSMPINQCLQSNSGGSLENFCSSSTSAKKGTKMAQSKSSAANSKAIRARLNSLRK